MLYTLIFGTPVYAHDKHIGKLRRIIVDNGIANQITVDAGLLGTERVVPINVLEETSAETIRLNATDVEWKAFAAYQMQQSITSSGGDSPNLSALTSDQVVSGGITDSSHNDTSSRRTVRTVADTSVVLTSRTAVINDDATNERHYVRGLVADTGRPQQLLLEDGSAVPFEAVTLFDESQIHIGGEHQAPVLEADQESITPILERPLTDRDQSGQALSKGE